MFHLLDIIGTMAFAMSGALTAMSKKLDPFGVFIIELVLEVRGVIMLVVIMCLSALGDVI